MFFFFLNFQIFFLLSFLWVLTKNCNKMCLYYLWTSGICDNRSWRIQMFAHPLAALAPISPIRGPAVRRWFKSTLLFIKATLRTKKVACQNLFSRRHRATYCFLIEIFLQFRVFLLLSTCYFHLKKKKEKEKKIGNCGTVRVKINSSLIY